MNTCRNTNCPIVYYDGCCGFCTWVVKTVRSLSYADQKITFLPYQVVSQSSPDELLLVYGSQYSVAGLAAIQLFKEAGGVFSLPALILKMLPRKIVNSLYYSLARNRYKWFGKTICVLD